MSECSSIIEVDSTVALLLCCSVVFDVIELTKSSQPDNSDYQISRYDYIA